MALQESNNNQLTAHDEMAERIRILYGQFPIVVGGSIFVATIVLGVVWFNEPSTTLIAWWFSFIVLAILRFTHFFYSRPLLTTDKKIESGTLKKLSGTALLAAGLSGCLWGLVPLLFYDAAKPELVIFLIIVNLGMTSGSVAGWSSYMPTYIVFALPNTIPLIVMLLLQNDTYLSLLAAMITAFLGANIGFGFQLQKSVLRSIALRSENVDLIKRLQHEIDRAEQASQEKTMFIAAASHDLRQPMNALRLFVSSLKTKNLPSDAQEPLNNIERSAKSLSDMLNAVLDISKFESGAAQPEKTNFPIQQIFSILIEEFTSMARNKGLQFKMVPSSYTVYTDPYMLERIIRNFLSNAYRYTDSGTILIGCRRHGEKIHIEVHDTGRGIDVNHSGKIFKEFFRAASIGGNGHPTGLGLGLAIVDSLSRTLDHPVHVFSHRTTGSMFSVEVPLGQEDACQQVFEPIAAMGLIDGELLIIDDDELSRGGLFSITSQWVQTVHVAASIKEAIAAIEDGEITPDAIISDYRLEHNDNGIKAIGAVRQVLNKTIPAALISGETGDEIYAIAEANDLPLLRKPIAPAQLRAAVMFLLKNNAQTH